MKQFVKVEVELEKGLTTTLRFSDVDAIENAIDRLVYARLELIERIELKKNRKKKAVTSEMAQMEKDYQELMKNYNSLPPMAKKALKPLFDLAEICHSRLQGGNE